MGLQFSALQSVASGFFSLLFILVFVFVFSCYVCVVFMLFTSFSVCFVLVLSLALKYLKLFFGNFIFLHFFFTYACMCILFCLLLLFVLFFSLPSHPRLNVSFSIISGFRILRVTSAELQRSFFFCFPFSLCCNVIRLFYMFVSLFVYVVAAVAAVCSSLFILFFFAPC